MSLLQRHLDNGFAHTTSAPGNRDFHEARRLHAAGTTILLVEQNARMALQVASRGYVLQTGAIIFSDSAASLADNEMVRKAYLGEH